MTHSSARGRWPLWPSPCRASRFAVHRQRQRVAPQPVIRAGGESPRAAAPPAAAVNRPVVVRHAPPDTARTAVRERAAPAATPAAPGVTGQPRAQERPQTQPQPTPQVPPQPAPRAQDRPQAQPPAPATQNTDANLAARHARERVDLNARHAAERAQLQARHQAEEKAAQDVRQKAATPEAAPTGTESDAGSPATRARGDPEAAGRRAPKVRRSVMS